MEPLINDFVLFKIDILIYTRALEYLRNKYKYLCYKHKNICR